MEIASGHPDRVRLVRMNRATAESANAREEKVEGRGEAGALGRENGPEPTLFSTLPP